MEYTQLDKFKTWDNRVVIDAEVDGVSNHEAASVIGISLSELSLQNLQDLYDAIGSEISRRGRPEEDLV